MFGGGGKEIIWFDPATPSSISSAGNSATGYGSGGGGALTAEGNITAVAMTGAAGGAGSSGVIIIYEYK